MINKFCNTSFHVGMMCDLKIHYKSKGSFLIIAVDFDHGKVKLKDCPFDLWHKFDEIELWEETQ